MSNALFGRKFVLIGTFTVYQYEVKDLIIEHGGEVLDFIPAGSIPDATIVVGGKTSEDDLAINKKYQYLRSNRVFAISEGILAEAIRQGIEIQEKRAEETQAKIANTDYGAW